MKIIFHKQWLILIYLRILKEAEVSLIAGEIKETKVAIGDSYLARKRWTNMLHYLIHQLLNYREEIDEKSRITIEEFVKILFPWLIKENLDLLSLSSLFYLLGEKKDRFSRRKEISS